jgi:nucleoside-diphosphate-sugar epimerase
MVEKWHCGRRVGRRRDAGGQTVRNPTNLRRSDRIKRLARHHGSDIMLAREVLGWEPRVGLDDGLKRTIAWFETSSVLDA